MFLKTCLNSLGALVLIAVTAFQANALTVYSNDFSSGAATGFTGASTVSTAPNGQKFIGSLNNSATATLNLSSLAAHSMVTLEFDVYGFYSLDGFNCCGPDRFIVNNGATTLVNDIYDIVNSDGIQGPFVASANDPAAFGYGAAWSGVFTYHYSLTFADSSSLLSLSFIGATDQGWPDEGFGLDNVRVSTNATLSTTATDVPEPASLLLCSIGLAGLTGLRGVRRRKTV